MVDFIAKDINKFEDQMINYIEAYYSLLKTDKEKDDISNIKIGTKAWCEKIINLLYDYKKNDEKKKKKKEVDKSHVILEVKGWEADQDLEALAKKIISTIKKDGLSWNTGYKFEEVAFGVKKLVIAFLAEDDKCSVQEVQDELESWTDDIQSVDIVSFNKS